MHYAKYVGWRLDLKGETALVRWRGPFILIAQFDNMQKLNFLAIDWHAFPATDFVIFR